MERLLPKITQTTAAVLEIVHGLLESGAELAPLLGMTVYITANSTGLVPKRQCMSYANLFDEFY
jgi:hypothetical protein